MKFPNAQLLVPIFFLFSVFYSQAAPVFEQNSQDNGAFMSPHMHQLRVLPADMETDLPDPVFRRVLPKGNWIQPLDFSIIMSFAALILLISGTVSRKNSFFLLGVFILVSTVYVVSVQGIPDSLVPYFPHDIASFRKVLLLGTLAFGMTFVRFLLEITPGKLSDLFYKILLIAQGLGVFIAWPQNGTDLMKQDFLTVIVLLTFTYVLSLLVKGYKSYPGRTLSLASGLVIVLLGAWFQFNVTGPSLTIGSVTPLELCLLAVLAEWSITTIITLRPALIKYT
ncbi:MAG: hypothetical protein OEY56_05505 [Cyclobacteriaceae bacterium]|nr:hypothetical protein [Cyclobacteriaceae bacterium]